MVEYCKRCSKITWWKQFFDRSSNNQSEEHNPKTLKFEEKECENESTLPVKRRSEIRRRQAMNNKDLGVSALITVHQVRFLLSNRMY